MNPGDARRLVSIAGIAGFTGIVFMATPAFAASGTQALAQGKCAGRSAVSMQLATTDRGLIEVGFEVDASPVNHSWSVALKHNGSVYFAGTRVAKAGTFSVDRVVANHPGVDVFSGIATDIKTGAVCKVSARI